MKVLIFVLVLAVAGAAVGQDGEAVETAAEVTETAEQAEPTDDTGTTVPDEAGEAVEAAEAAVERKPPVDAYAEVNEIMLHLCMECHGDFNPDAGFKLPTTREGQGIVGVPSTQRDDLLLIDLENPEASYFIMKLRNDPGILGRRMPMARSLSDEQLAMFDLWVEELAGPVAEEPEAVEAATGETDDGAAGSEDDDADMEDADAEPENADEEHENADPEHPESDDQ